MKKILALCIALLLIFAVVGCGDETPKGDDVLKLNFYVMYKGEQVKVGVEAKDIIPKLGEYKSEDGEACGTNEKDVIYTLSGIEIETHVSGESEIIRQIKIIDDSQTTVEGITIGSTRDEVIAAYGKVYTEGSSGAIRYEGDASAIEFHFGSSGNVSNIYIKRR
ncbi:MAG: hypothetical protein IKB02_10420 [Clostridia bacterium]|nr:hypothetical protein [Clostridia bacterium]MBR2389148.1 hypothetical protein [Clostridia bacterium]